MIRKIVLIVSVLVLMCFVFTGFASADYTYENVDQIPMAVDFSVRVDFDADGMPHVVTDYPFETTGATEMNLVYNKGDRYEAVTLNYRYATDETSIGSWSGDLFSDDRYDEMYRAIRDGEVTLDDHVTVNTSHFNKKTDWVLVYSLREKNYVEYMEKTHAQAFNAMGTGGVARSIYYRDGEFESARILRRIDDADLDIGLNEYGTIDYAYIVTYSPEFSVYNYDPSTGLFDGKTLTELGFDENDLSTEGFTSVETQTQTAVSVPASAPQVTAKSSVRMIGGLLAGIMVGITLYYMFRRRKIDKKDRPSVQTDVNRKDESTAESPEVVETPEVMSASSGRQ